MCTHVHVHAHAVLTNSHAPLTKQDAQDGRPVGGLLDAAVDGAQPAVLALLRPLAAHPGADPQAELVVGHLGLVDGDVPGLVGRKLERKVGVGDGLLGQGAPLGTACIREGRGREAREGLEVGSSILRGSMCAARDQQTVLEFLWCSRSTTIALLTPSSGQSGPFHAESGHSHLASRRTGALHTRALSLATRLS